jgi:hypothetical protein
LVEEAYFDADGKPLTADGSFYRRVVQYPASANGFDQTYYGADNKLFLTTDGFAMSRIEQAFYDAVGHLVAHCPAAATDFGEARSACRDATGDPVVRRIVVSAIDKAGQATEVGIQAGDILESYSGHEIRSTSQARELVDRSNDVRPVLVVRRSNQRMEFALRPGRIGIHMMERFVPVDTPDGVRAGN